ncbi:MAG TPA: S-methyl-5-thioribose-1-phosphate isomerase [Acidimicrobiales bacterium]|nr:S-methyl-5-thioribose-1-phosphate isomerase [Acidimicrobiales bacterium]
MDEDLRAGQLPATIDWREDRVRLVDQRRLPEALTFVEAATVDELCSAIRDLVVRGAPALGVAGAMGVALAWRHGEDVDRAAARLIATRPTAVNLRWGVERALAAPDPVAEALTVAAEDIERNHRLGRHGSALLPDGARVLTHCNAGSLACAGYGTAVGVIRAAHESGRRPRVWVDETRPVLQGSRLTAWELHRLGVPATVVVDGAAASLMAKGDVDCVVVGADRIAANGDVANKVGTYSLAVLARHHRIPFYVAAPLSTVDPACRSGAAITVEQRDPGEVIFAGDRRVVPEGVEVANPAFDVTPARLVSAIITEAGIARRPYRAALAGLLAQG